MRGVFGVSDAIMNAPFDKPSLNIRLARAPKAPALASVPAPSAAQTMQPEVDIGALIRRVFAHWQVVIVTLVLGGVITSQVVRARVPSYKSETVIFYREGIGRSTSSPSERETIDLRQLGTKLKETLLAQQTLRQVIDEYRLYPDTLARTGYADAVDQMRKKSDFKSRSQDTFAISFEGTDRDQAQKVCARMAEILIRSMASRLADDNRSTIDFLMVEKRRADEELDRTEREISEFLAAHPEFLNAREGLGAEVIARQKAEDELRRRKPGSFPGSRLRRNRTEPVPGLPSVVARAPSPAVDPVLISARSQAITELMAARRDLADKTLKYTDQHPDVKAAQARITAAEQSLRGAEEAIAAAMPKEEAPPPPRKVASIDDPYDNEDGGAPRAPGPEGAEQKPKAAGHQGDKAVSLEVEWARLTRSLSVVRTRQADLDHKLYRAELNASTNEGGFGPTIAVLDPAYRPSTPSNAPNRTIVLIGLGVSIALGLVLSAAWGLFLDDRVFSPLEIETIVMVPVLGSVPRDEKKGQKKKGKLDKGTGTARAAAESMRGSSRA